MVQETQETRELTLEEKLKALTKETEDIGEDALADILDEKGNLQVDMSLPEDYELEVVAQTMLSHLMTYTQNEQAYHGAKQAGDQARRTQLWQQMMFNKMTIAIIQRKYPRAKTIADAMAQVQARQIKQNREKALEGD